MPNRLLLLAVLVAMSALAQTSTVYDLSTAVPALVCQAGPEDCTYQLPTGAFLAGGYWTQFDYRAYPGQNPGYNADYCNGTSVWTVSDTPGLGPTAKLFTMDCHATDLHGVPSKLHAEISAHSFVATFPCGARIRTICHQTRWAIDTGSFLEITK